MEYISWDSKGCHTCMAKHKLQHLATGLNGKRFNTEDNKDKEWHLQMKPYKMEEVPLGLFLLSQPTQGLM